MWKNWCDYGHRAGNFDFWFLEAHAPESAYSKSKILRQGNWLLIDQRSSSRRDIFEGGVFSVVSVARGWRK
jgi:hypothetical protein